MMLSRKTAFKIFQYVICVVVMSVAVLLIIEYGVEKKTWPRIAWEFAQEFASKAAQKIGDPDVDAKFLIGGGVLGVVAGAFIFFTFGSIGWVSGPIFGSLGLWSLVAGGGIGGAGLGVITEKAVDIAQTAINIAQHPNHYIFHWTVIIAIFVGGLVIAYGLSRSLAARVGVPSRR